MKARMILIPAVVLILICSAAAPPAASFQYAKFLTVDDVQKVTALKGVTQVPQSAQADGDLNFARQDGKLILSVTFLPSTGYVGARSSKAGFKSTLPGVGEEAFIGPAGTSPSFILVFRKAAYTVMMETVLEGNGTRLSVEQLTALAKIIASRM